ncbi:MAG: phospholipase D-like domain-containing protein, partial [Vulcanimicrobiaceae bacterium]
RKDAALALEARLIASSRGDRIDVESESFGDCAVARSLTDRARAGTSVRLLVNRHLLASDANGRELAALDRLAQAGVEIRVGAATDKLAIAGSGGWVGSANATRGVPATTDWGARTRARGVVAALHDRFVANWQAAKPYVADQRAPGGVIRAS